MLGTVSLFVFFIDLTAFVCRYLGAYPLGFLKPIINIVIHMFLSYLFDIIFAFHFLACYMDSLALPFLDIL